MKIDLPGYGPHETPYSERDDGDEFSCPCCGAPTDGSHCAACDAAECGERDYDDPSINVCLVQRAKTAAKLAAPRAPQGAVPEVQQMTPDPRDTFAIALERMRIAHEALVERRTEGAFVEFHAEALAARRAFDALQLAKRRRRA